MSGTCRRHCPDKTFRRRQRQTIEIERAGADARGPRNSILAESQAIFSAIDLACEHQQVIETADAGRCRTY